MGLKKILKKVTCRIFFCVGSKCTYNEKGEGKFNINLDENNISDNNNEVNKTGEIEDWPKEI